MVIKCSSFSPLQTSENVNQVVARYQTIHLPLRFFILNDPYDQIREDFPSLFSSSLSGILPLCMIPHRLYITTQSIIFRFLTYREVDDESLRFLGIRTILSNRTEFPSYQSLQKTLQKGSLLLITEYLYSNYTYLYILLLYHIVTDRISC